MLPVLWPTGSSFCSRCLSLSNRGLLFHLNASQTIYDTHSDGPGAVFRLLRLLPQDCAPSHLKEL